MILWCSKCGEDREASTVGPLVCSWCFGPLTPRDWPAFWQSLTPAEVRDALGAAPKVAGEWEQYDECWGNDDGKIEREPRWARDTDFGPDLHMGAPAQVRPTGDAWEWRAACFDWYPSASLDEAKSAADAALRQAGWVLL